MRIIVKKNAIAIIARTITSRIRNTHINPGLSEEDLYNTITESLLCHLQEEIPFDPGHYCDRCSATVTTEESNRCGWCTPKDMIEY